jgi:hypothetical protein
VINKIYQLLAHGRWFSPGTLTSSTTKSGHHDIAEILLKMALRTKNQSDKTKQEFYVKQFYDDLVYYLIFKSWIKSSALYYRTNIIVLSIFLRFTASDYPFDIFKLFLYRWKLLCHED